MGHPIFVLFLMMAWVGLVGCGVHMSREIGGWAAWIIFLAGGCLFLASWVARGSL